MPQLILRDVEFTLIRALRKRAAKNGRTEGEEHLAILKQALGIDQPAGTSIGGLMAAFGISGPGTSGGGSGGGPG